MPSVYTVNTTVDDPNGRVAGQETLRDALNDANANPGSTILFNIPTTAPGYKAGVWSIQPTAALPTITAAGTTIQGTANGALPLIDVDGAKAGGSGFDVEASNVTIEQLRIDNWPADGIRIGHTSIAANTLITSNYVGYYGANGFGISVEQHATNTVIGKPTQGNIIEGNSEGLFIENAAATTVQSNSISHNRLEGIVLSSPLPNSALVDTTIGGSSQQAVEGNQIDYNLTGILVTGATVHTLVQGNTINSNTDGIDIGIAGLGPSSDVPASGVTIGGGQAGADNDIIGNKGYGVEIVGSQNIIQGYGNQYITNNGYGVSIHSGNQNAILNNRIGHNDLGIQLNNGANNNAAAPVLTSAYYLNSKRDVTVHGTLDGAANTVYRVELFSNSPSNRPQGELFAKAINVTTDGSGHAWFTTSLSIPPDYLITATATDPRNNTSVFSNAVVAKPEVYVLGEDHKLWLESPDWRQNGRMLIDTNVESFAPTDNGQVYVEGIDHKLWLEGAGWQQNGRTLIDLNVQAIAVADNGKVYVIGTDTKLWLEGPDWQQNGRTFIDLYVQAVAPVLNSQNTQVYVVGTDHKLWLEGAGWQQNGRTFIDLYVQAVATAGPDQVYVEGIDHKLWLEGPRWQQNGRSFIDLNVEAFAPADNGKVYVEGTDHKLWLEGADWQKNGRTFVDLYVKDVKSVLASENSQVYVLGMDTKLWLEGPDWQKNGRTFVDLYVESI